MGVWGGAGSGGVTAETYVFRLNVAVNHTLGVKIVQAVQELPNLFSSYLFSFSLFVSRRNVELLNDSVQMSMNYLLNIDAENGFKERKRKQFMLSDRVVVSVDLYQNISK